jgi:acetyl-CoA decarbonylase/synthase complex subunit delta
MELVKERYPGCIGEVTLGATAAQGGTRGHTRQLGGDKAMPFLGFEGAIPHRPLVAMEVVDRVPEWPDPLAEALGPVLDDPAAWARRCVEELGADLICLRLQSADPELGDAGPKECAATVRQVLQAVPVPLVVVGCGLEAKDNLVLPYVAEACAGENLLLGAATQENYRTLTAACLVYGHALIALSPIDISIGKQLNILIGEMGLPLERVVSDPTTGALGYGIEYTYSIIERWRLGALSGDRALALPAICQEGQEAWRTKEAGAHEEVPGWGDSSARGVLWEALTATALLQAGAHLVVLRHPRAVCLVKRHIDEMMGAGEAVLPGEEASGDPHR